jgi:hypothetical protein
VPDPQHAPFRQCICPAPDCGRVFYICRSCERARSIAARSVAGSPAGFSIATPTAVISNRRKAASIIRTARGNEKGRVERAIQYIRHSFFAARSFASPADLNRQALIWRDEIAHQRPWPGDDSRRVIDALSEEKPRLLALPVNAFETDLLKPIRSDKTIYVCFDQKSGARGRPGRQERAVSSGVGFDFGFEL